MKQKLTINDVLNELGFNEKQKQGFVECVKAVKREQKEEDYKAEEEIAKTVKEVCSDEN
ncbi:MAG: hypothetical protein MJ220_02840 [Bacilli bacterium]|nr:hypothetical protein [Bacilli bacterium]